MRLYKRVKLTNDDLRFLIYSIDLTIRERLQGTSPTYERERKFAEELKERLENREARDH